MSDHIEGYPERHTIEMTRMRPVTSNASRYMVESHPRTSDDRRVFLTYFALHPLACRSVMNQGFLFSVESLLDGRVVDDWALGEVANQLRLPSSGPFVVVAAEVSSMGSTALPGIESKLRSLDAYSAWRLLPDLHVGIVHIYSEPHLDKVSA